MTSASHYSRPTSAVALPTGDRLAPLTSGRRSRARRVAYDRSAGAVRRRAVPRGRRRARLPSHHVSGGTAARGLLQGPAGGVHGRAPQLGAISHSRPINSRHPKVLGMSAWACCPPGLQGVGHGLPTRRWRRRDNSRSLGVSPGYCVGSSGVLSAREKSLGPLIGEHRNDVSKLP